jgi:phosphatidylinositol glycan class B
MEAESEQTTGADVKPGLLASPLIISLGTALAIRLFIAIVFPNTYAPDEIFQYIEQAHRLVFGQGVVPWEYQVGLRSWLIPLLLAAPMALAHWCTPTPLAGLMLIRVLLCLASLPIVWCATKWGERFHGTAGAWTAGLLTAIWPDLWLMAPHPLEEALSTDLLVPAIYLVEASRGQTGLRHVPQAGILLGLTFALREQLAPAVAIAGIFLCGRDVKRWLLAVSMAAVPVLCLGLLDWFTWGEMFRSFWMNVYLNIILGVASHYFDSSPPTYYLLNLLYDWLWGALFVGYFAWLGARKLPVAGLAALAIIAVHSGLAHKELRFIFPAMALLIPLAGLGLAGICASKTMLQKAVLTAGLLTGPYMSPLLYMMLPWQDNAFRLYAGLAAEHPCIVSIQTWDRGFLPILPVFHGTTRFTGESTNSTRSGHVEADAIIAAEGTATIPRGFTRQSCAKQSWIPFKPRKPDVCVWTRPVASCRAGPIEPFVLVYPPAARPFIIRDRLTDGP